MQAGAGPKEPAHAVTQAFPFASSLDVAQRPERLELLRRERHFPRSREDLRQGLVRLPLRLEELRVLLRPHENERHPADRGPKDRAAPAGRQRVLDLYVHVAHRRDAGRGGPEGTAPFRFTRQVAVYDPLLIVAMAASAARRDLDLNQVRREEHALDSGRRVRIPLDDEVLVDVGVHRDLGKLVRLR